MLNVYVSVGEYCATAYQIRRVTGRDDSYFFDWLVARGNSFDFLAKANDSFFLPGNWEIVDGGIRVLEKQSRLIFQHEFKTIVGQAGMVDPDAVEAHLPAAYEKFVYLKSKLINRLRHSARVVVIRAENAVKTPAQAMERLGQLNMTFLPINQGTKFILASTQLEKEEFMPNFLFVRLANSTPANGADAWKGDNRSWDRLFELAEKSFEWPEGEVAPGHIS